MPVSIGPGATTLIRTPLSANSRSGCLSKAFHSVLAANVESSAWCTRSSISRGNVDDAAMALRKDDPQLMFHAQQRAKHIRVKCCCIGLCRLVRKWSRFAFGASVIDCHVQAAEAREGVVNKFFDISFLAHIRPHKLRFSTESSKLDDKLLSSLS